MVGRSLVALLIALLSLPAMAASGHLAPLAPMSPAAAMHHHGTRHHAPQAPAHHQADATCVGCIAPATFGGPGIVAPIAYPVAAPAAVVGGGAALQSARPATPPPRAG